MTNPLSTAIPDRAMKPTAAEIESRGRIAGVYDKGKAALIVIETETAEKGGEKLFTNRFSIFARGEGGFGGEAGPKAAGISPSSTSTGNDTSPPSPKASNW